MKTQTIERESKSITWVWNKKLSQKLLQMIFFFYWQTKYYIKEYVSALAGYFKLNRSNAKISIQERIHKGPITYKKYTFDICKISRPQLFFVHICIPKKKIASVEITCSYFWYKTLLFLSSKVKNFKYQIHMNYSSNFAYHFLGWGSQNKVQRLTHPLWQCSSLINRFALQFFSLINLLSNF